MQGDLKAMLRQSGAPLASPAAQNAVASAVAQAAVLPASRRAFLKGAAATSAGLVLALSLPMAAKAQSGAAMIMTGDGSEGAFVPNAFLQIAPDNTVTVLVKHIEFGQGPYTGLATIAAEELDADWSQMRAEAAPANNELYKNLAFGIQGTGGSTAIANSFEQMRKAGASARAMLVEAAAKRWNVRADEIKVEKGVVFHQGVEKQATFGELAEEAAQMTPPAEPTLKDPSDFKLIGTDLTKLDSQAKSTGAPLFTIDVERPNQLTAIVLHPPKVGATVARFDDSAARAVDGVVDVKQIPQGIAVIAEGYWQAHQGREALTVEWDETNAVTVTSSDLLADYKETAQARGAIAAQAGDVDAALEAGATLVEATYEFPFLAHATLEPLDAVVELREGEAEAWLGSQLQTVDQGAIAQVFGLDPAKVSVNTQYAGGSFGRRAQPGGEFVAEAAEVVKAHGKQNTPIRLIWSREDDMGGWFYRPVTVHKLRGAVDGDGAITAWDQVIVSQSIVSGTPFEMMIQDGIDPTMVEGAADMPYAIPNKAVSVHIKDIGVPVLWWRSVGHTHTAYAVEAFLDELFAQTGTDPVEGRLALLNEEEYGREIAVLRKVAEIADWGGPVPEGRARGVALHKSFSSYVAMVAEVSQADEGIPRVHKVWTAIDCGIAVNPNIIRAQIEGGLGYGLSATLFEELPVEGGEVQTKNFDAYRILRINEMPEVEVAIIPSAEAPTGVGEPGTPPIGPAVANAWAALTGNRVHRLPFVQGVA